MTPEPVLSPISGDPCEALFESRVLGKHKAEYFLDRATGYIFAKQPYWLDEAYSDAIAVTDTGILDRNLRNIRVCSEIFDRISAGGAGFRGVDLGAGYGVFVRGMRDAGFDFSWHDPYAANLMARGFEAAPGRYDAAVAFEVLEHTTNPLQFLKAIREKFDFSHLLFSATCFDPEDIPGLDWWYWAFETGQHVSFFSRKTLDFIAASLDMRVAHLDADIYLMYDPARPGDIVAATARRGGGIWSRLARARHKRHKRRKRKPLTWEDHIRLRDALRARG